MGQALDADSFNVITVFLKGDWVIRGVMIGLALASIWSWVVILSKLFGFIGMNRQAQAFEQAVNSGRSLDDVAAQAGDNPQQPLPMMLVATLKDWRDARSKGALNEAQGALLMTRIDRTLDSLIARESRRVEEGLGVLSVVATSSPFIGLFGTVWGIMNAFHSIALEKNTNLATVAPAISEALFATALGLAAAIPAYIFYNKFTLDAGKFTARLEGFADDLSGAIARRLGERLGDRAA